MQMLDLYRFQLEEIESARLKPGEDESLADERRKLTHAEKLTDAVIRSVRCAVWQQRLIGAVTGDLTGCRTS